MDLQTRVAIIATTASATQNLPENAVMVVSVVGQTGGATTVAAVNYPVVTGAPAAGQAQFSGTPAAPSKTLTFNAALAANGLLYVTFVPVGGLPSNI